MGMWSGHTIPTLEKKTWVVKNPHNFAIIMKARMSVLLIASSESFPDHANNTSYYNNRVSTMLEYLLIWGGSCKQRENEAPLQNMLNLLPL